MREIKFRGKSKNVNEWCYGTYIFTDDNRNNPFRTGPFKESHRIVFWCSGDWNMGGWVDEEVIPETIGQYTGLKDKNGKEIYEGDVLHIKQYENNGYRLFGTDVSFPNCFTLDECKGKLLREGNELVYFSEGCMCVGDMFISALFGDMRYSFPLFELEIIGNIHDNPELIKEGEL